MSIRNTFPVPLIEQLENSIRERAELLAALRIAEDALGSDNPAVYLSAMDAVTTAIAKAGSQS